MGPRASALPTWGASGAEDLSLRTPFFSIAYTPPRALSRMHTLFWRLATRHVANPTVSASSTRGLLPPHAYAPLHILPRTCQTLDTRPLTLSSATRRYGFPVFASRPRSVLEPRTRSFSTWLQRFSHRRHSDPLDEPSDCHEEAAKIAMLEKAMKGRQPADLMLRCESSADYAQHPR